VNCYECGKDLSGSRPVEVGDKLFCNNLCKYLWNKKNPGNPHSSNIWGKSQEPKIIIPERTPSSATKRIVWGLVWFILLYLLALLISGGIVGTIAGINNPSNAHQAASIAAQTLVQKYGPFILGGIAFLVILGTLGGVLPGTSRWKRHKKSQEGIPYRPFGPFASFFLTVILICIVSAPLAVGAGVMAFKAKQSNQELSTEAIKKSLENNGTLLSYSILISFITVIPLTLLLMLTKGRKNLFNYAALRAVAWQKVLLWIGISLILMLTLDAIAFLAKKPLVPEVMLSQYKSAHFLWLLGLGMIVLAPLYEELLIRGFLFKGFLKSSLGPIGAVMLSGLFWSIVHFQYDVAMIFGIFVFSILLGLARLNTKSLLTPIAMHIFWNIGAFIETAYFAGKMIK